MLFYLITIVLIARNLTHGLSISGSASRVILALPAHTARHGLDLPTDGWSRDLDDSFASKIKELRVICEDLYDGIASDISVVHVHMGQGAYWNPSILRMPPYFRNQYLVVSRTITEGMHQKVVYCEASLGDQGGFSCKTPSQYLDIPASAAKLCSSKHISGFSDFPGLHDPRLLVSNQGEIMLVGGTQSASACYGLSAITLSKQLCPEILHNFQKHNAFHIAPFSTFTTLTEINRPGPREELEKNWVPIISPHLGLFIQHDLNPSKRTISKHLGSGIIVSVLQSHTSKCFPASTADYGAWHQATNSLELILCNRMAPSCAMRSVFLSLVHLKITNKLGLMEGGKYERFVAIWDTSFPFRLIALGSQPILFANEKEGSRRGSESFSSTFAYSVSITWDIEEVGQAGFLDDDMIISIGKGDYGTFAAKLSASELLRMVRMCPEYMDIQS